MSRLIGYDRYLRKPKVGRALLSYLPVHVWHEITGRGIGSFSNQGIANALPRALNELGYTVDIVSFDDVEFEPTNNYDVLVQHGGTNFDRLISSLPADITVIYFASTTYWRTSNEREQERVDAFRARNGVSIPPDRLIEESEDQAIDRAAGTISIGGQSILETYAHVPLALALDIGVFPDEMTVLRDVSTAREHFVFFGGFGNIHKGLDLALEAFAELPHHLHVATLMQPEFAAYYDELIRTHPNLHVHGWLEARGPVFYELMSKCAFAILPTSAEGQPGSIVECMNAGLIPLVTREANLDVDGFGMLIEPSVEGIRRAVKAAADLPTDELERRSDAARQVARVRHSPERFLETLRHHLQVILESAGRPTNADHGETHRSRTRRSKG
jgi:glycosyltransferase involved in cell wall biosynthesis